MGRMASEITEIAQAINLLSARMVREDGLGAAESELLQLVKAQPGISQKEVCVQLGMDKGAVARRAVNLEQKGFLVRRSNPADGRSQVLFPTEKADGFKGSGDEAEDVFCDWLLEVLPKEERDCFCEMLEELCERSMKECGEGYPNVCERLQRPIFEAGRLTAQSGRSRTETTVRPEKTVRPGKAVKPEKAVRFGETAGQPETAARPGETAGQPETAAQPDETLDRPETKVRPDERADRSEMGVQSETVEEAHPLEETEPQKETPQSVRRAEPDIWLL